MLLSADSNTIWINQLITLNIHGDVMLYHMSKWVSQLQTLGHYLNIVWLADLSSVQIGIATTNADNPILLTHNLSKLKTQSHQSVVSSGKQNLSPTCVPQ